MFSSDRPEDISIEKVTSYNTKDVDVLFHIHGQEVDEVTMYISSNQITEATKNLVIAKDETKFGNTGVDNTVSFLYLYYITISLVKML